MVSFPSIDTNLFVDAYSKGLQQGKANPSIFSTVVNSFIEGIEENQKFMSEDLNNQIKQHAIDQQPVEDRIRAAQADSADAQVAAYRDNPEAWLKLQQEKRDAETRRLEEQAALDQKRTELMDIVNSGDGVAVGQAYNSGKYADVFAADPNLDKTIVKQTMSGWDPNDQQSYFYAKNQERIRDWNNSIQETMTKKEAVDREAFLGNGYLMDLADKAEVSPLQLIMHGEVRTINVPAKVPLKEKAADGSEQVVMKNGSVVMVPADINSVGFDPMKAGAIKQQKALYIGDKLITDDFSDADAYKIFSNYKHSYKYTSGLLNGTDGDGDRKAEIERLTKATSARQAAAQAAADAAKKTEQSDMDSFMSGLKVTDTAKPYFDKVRQTREQNLQEQRPAAERAQPELVSAERQTEAPKLVATPTKAGAMSNEEFFSKAVTFAQEPAKEQTIKFQGDTIPEPSWAKNMRVRQDIASAKAQISLQRVQAGRQAASNQPAPPPAAQAAQASASPQVPEKIYTAGKADLETVTRVAGNPKLQGFSALVKGVVAAESGGRSEAVSPTGVKGMMQVTGKTGKALIEGFDASNPMESVVGGAIELERLNADPVMKQNPMLVLTAYNVGAGPVAEAISLAGGSTDWQTVKKFLPQAIMSPRFAPYWKSIGVNPADKAKEASAYAERVVPYFAAFARTTDDMNIAVKLKNQGVIDF